MYNRLSGEMVIQTGYLQPPITLAPCLPALKCGQYGGLIYEGLNEGNIMALKVLQATNATSATSANTTANSTASPMS